MARLQERAATMKVVQTSPRTYQVSSASVEGRWYTVHAAADEPLSSWSCSCQGSGGRAHLCGHKVRVVRELALDLGLLTTDRSLPAPAPRSKPVKPTASVNGRTVEWVGTITDRATAVQVHGGVEGGARVTLDIPDDGTLAEIVGALTAMRRMPLWIKIEPDTSKENDRD